MSLAIGIYLFGMANMKEFRASFRSFNDNLKAKPSRAELMEQLNESVRFAYFKQLVDEEIFLQFLRLILIISTKILI